MEPIPLSKLEPEFMRVVSLGRYDHPEKMADAQGVWFLCPVCFTNNDGPVGTHMVLIWFKGRGAPPEETPTPRWEVSGTGLADLTIKPSIHTQGGCGWHGFITNGVAT